MQRNKLSFDKEILLNTKKFEKTVYLLGFTGFIRQLENLEKDPFYENNLENLEKYYEFLTTQGFFLNIDFS